MFSHISFDDVVPNHCKFSRSCNFFIKMNQKPQERSFIMSWKKGFHLHYFFMFFPFSLVFMLTVFDRFLLFSHITLFNYFFMFLCLHYSTIFSYYCAYDIQLSSLALMLALLSALLFFTFAYHIVAFVYHAALLMYFAFTFYIALMF